MATRLIAVAILALGLLPIANLIPGGETDVEYAARMLDWLQGTGLVIGAGVLAFIVARQRAGMTAPATDPVSESTAAADPLGSTGAGRPSTGGAGGSDIRFVLGTVFAALLLYVAVAWYVFSAHPLLIDEVVQVLQARWYASGRLSVPTFDPPEWTSIMHIVDLGPRTYGQFPAGGPAMLALGSLVGAEWIVGPVAGALCVLLFGFVLREVEPTATRRFRRGALLLFALAPFGVFMFGSHMNHVTTMFWLLLAAVALMRATHDAGAPWWGLLAGFALGTAATIRPMDGAAFALPAAGWLFWRARRGRRPLASLLLSGAGIAIPIAALLYVNSRTTGHALLFGYDQLWGANHGIGFHAAPWGPVHTPLRGLELLSKYITQLGTLLFELPFPSTLLIATGFWFAPKLTRADRYLLVSGGILLVGYWAYWHDGDYLGPRFLVPLLPIVVLWSARALRTVRTRAGNGPGWVGVRTATGLAMLLAATDLAFVRVPMYRNGLTSMRLEVEREAARAGVQDAVVLVKESWGARLVTRMWALGVPRSTAEFLYRKVDACRLEREITRLERAAVRDSLAARELLPLLVDSASVIRTFLSPDVSARMQPGYPYTAECEAQIAMDWRGFSHLAPFRLARDSNLYLRWFPGREGEVAARYPGRPIYRLARAGYAVDAPLVWERLTFAAAK